jgi:hypothetical protein
MEKLLAQFLGDFAKGVSREGLRLVRIKALSASLKVAQAIRRLFLIQLGLVLICIVWALSLFSGGLLIIATPGPFELDSGTSRAVLFCMGTFAICSVLLWLVGRERTWITALGFQRQVDLLNADQASLAKSKRPHDGIDYGELERIIERVVGQKLNQEAHLRRDSSTDQTSTAN